MKKFAFIIFTLSMLYSCSSTKQEQEYDYFNVRIKPEYQEIYNTFPKKLASDSLKKADYQPRNGRALRGKISSMRNIIYKGECEGETSGQVVESYLEFYDRRAEHRSQVEWIPVDHVILLGPQQGLDSNYFETVNNTGDFGPITAVPVEDVVKDTCKKESKEEEIEEPEIVYDDCNCEDFRFGLDIDCIEKVKYDFIAELKGAYVYYTDEIENIGTFSEENIALDLYLGYRITEPWSVGLNYFSGTIIRDQFSEDEVNRPVVMLNSKYEFDTWLCMIPFVYGQFGMAIDNATINLFKVSTNEECCKEVDNPNLDISLPISWGLGFGVDLPVTPWVSLGLDMGYRSISFGESTRVFGVGNAPNKRTIDMFIFRTGLSF